MTSSLRRSISDSSRPLSGVAFRSFLFIAAFLTATCTFAGALQVNPVRATLGNGRAVEAISVRNDGNEPATIQLEPMTWSQREGKDVYAPTRDLIATPPIFTVPPGGTQIVRVGLRVAPNRSHELSYRLYFQEVPGAPSQGFQGLQVALRLGVPVFVRPVATNAKPELRWQLQRVSDGLRLSLTNSGNAHVQVLQVSLEGPRGPISSQSLSTYVLPGESRAWMMDASASAGDRIKLSAQTDSGDAATEVVVEAPR